MKKNLQTTLVAACLLCAVSSRDLPCYHDFAAEDNSNHIRASFDLSALSLISGDQLAYYSVEDIREIEDPDNSASNHDFLYQFNFCNPITEWPDDSKCSQKSFKYCPPDSWSKKDGCSAEFKWMTPSNGRGFAYQISMNNVDAGESAGCLALSNTHMDDESLLIEWNLLHAHDPSEGVSIKYLNGQWCNVGQRNREFVINLKCKQRYRNIPDSEPTFEDPKCVYTLDIDSIWGCPTECGISSNHLCGGQGLCGFDFTNDQAKCFCYRGFDGNSCGESSTIHLRDPFSPKKDDPDLTPIHIHQFNASMARRLSDEEQAEQSGDQRQVTEVVYLPVTYDLSAWHNEEGIPFIVNHSHEGASEHYTYYFNLFTDIDKSYLPDSCAKVTGPCLEFDDDNGNCLNFSTSFTKGTVFQVHKGAGGDCNLLGTANDFKWELLDSKEPAAGVVFTFTDGGLCADHHDDSVSQQNRQFRIEFECPQQSQGIIRPDPSDAIKNNPVRVYDSHSCQYVFTMESPLACPYECTTSEVRDKFGINLWGICNQHGMCASDPQARETRCLCDDGWMGGLCSNRDHHSDSGSGTDDHSMFQLAIAIVVSVMIVLIGVGLHFYLRSRKLKKKVNEMQIQLMTEEEAIEAATGGKTDGFIRGNVRLGDVSSDDEDDDDDEDLRVNLGANNAAGANTGFRSASSKNQWRKAGTGHIQLATKNPDSQGMTTGDGNGDADDDDDDDKSEEALGATADRGGGSGSD